MSEELKQKRGTEAGMKREWGESGDSGGVEMRKRRRRGGGVRVELARERAVEARKASRE